MSRKEFVTIALRLIAVLLTVLKIEKIPATIASIGWDLRKGHLFDPNYSGSVSDGILPFLVSTAPYFLLAWALWHQSDWLSRRIFVGIEHHEPGLYYPDEIVEGSGNIETGPERNEDDSSEMEEHTRPVPEPVTTVDVTTEVSELDYVDLIASPFQLDDVLPLAFAIIGAWTLADAIPAIVTTLTHPPPLDWFVGYLFPRLVQLLIGACLLFRPRSVNWFVKKHQARDIRSVVP